MTTCFLPGDRYPADNHVGEALRSRLEDILPDWTALPPPDGARDVETRVSAVRDRITGPSILVGRSSGARVATLFAARHGAPAVVCLGYPFRNPDLLIEPDRFQHLATIRVPTLIIQGAYDPYGGSDITDHYALSEAVCIRFVATDHELYLDPAQWDGVAATVRAFLHAVAAGTRFAPHRFDEAYYLARYPDVAAAIAAGQLDSAEQHFVRFGRAERRRFRYLTD